ncbi:hypothetical protein [Marinimicrococcus flavescens]|uniref:Uncharacterized protein n=1 Tax=Marinimicrococcus flavescens TaxID=3031815 RepID=A0AAP3UZL1_9PROT|nr:hypothetical protein [Marinimicrococcus flavescens]
MAALGFARDARGRAAMMANPRLAGTPAPPWSSPATRQSRVRLVLRRLAGLVPMLQRHAGEQPDRRSLRAATTPAPAFAAPEQERVAAALHRQFDAVLDEPVPEDMLALAQALGARSDGWRDTSLRPGPDLTSFHGQVSGGIRTATHD